MYQKANKIFKNYQANNGFIGYAGKEAIIFQKEKHFTWKIIRNTMERSDRL